MPPDSLPKTTEGLLTLLDEEIERRYEYVAKPLQRIDSIHKVINTTTDLKKSSIFMKPSVTNMTE